eukprot:4340526-Karenia_brevis.AAC.1
MDRIVPVKLSFRLMYWAMSKPCSRTDWKGSTISDLSLNSRMDCTERSLASTALLLADCGSGAGARARASATAVSQ